MKSMTGYGHASHVEDEYQLEVEIKSYNNRYLDIYVNLNPVLSPFEAYVTSRVKEVASRGKVEVAVRLKVFESRSTVHVAAPSMSTARCWTSTWLRSAT